MINQFKGVWTALITPMKDDDSVDYSALENLVEHQISSGVDGIVSVGTTGESPTLSEYEHIEVIRKTFQFANGRIPVLAGTGSNSTTEAVQMTKECEDFGVDGFLIVAPYYNKPSQEGVYLHFSEIMKVTQRPIMLYSIPGRCGIEISNDTAIRLSENFPNHFAMKEAGGKKEKVLDLFSKSKKIDILSGDDSLTLDFMRAGAKGIVSVASNIFPEKLVEMVNLQLNGNDSSADKIADQLKDVFKDLFIEPNPVPVKTAMQYIHMIPSAKVRLPLCKMSDLNIQKLLTTIHNLK